MSPSHFSNSLQKNCCEKSHPWAGLGAGLGPAWARLGPGLGQAWAGLGPGLGRNAEGRNDLTPARYLGISFIKVSHSVWHILTYYYMARQISKG